MTATRTRPFFSQIGDLGGFVRNVADCPTKTKQPQTRQSLVEMLSMCSRRRVREIG